MAKILTKEAIKQIRAGIRVGTAELVLECAYGVIESHEALRFQVAELEREKREAIEAKELKNETTDV